MKLTRRAAMAVSSVMITLAGCSTPSIESKTSDSELEASEEAKCINEDGELITPIRIDNSDMIEYVDVESGARIIEHEPSGKRWRWEPDGTFMSESVEAESICTDEFRPGSRYIGQDFANGEKETHVSKEPLEIWISPDGDDNAPGTQEKPISGLREASKRIPKHCRHKVRIYLKDGEYSAGFQLEDIYVSRAADKIKIIGHHPENPLYSKAEPSAVITTGGQSMGIRGGYGIEIKGITIDGRWQFYDSILAFEDCIFKTGTFNPARTLSGYTSLVYLDGCEFKDTERGIVLQRMSKIVIRNCTSNNISNRPISALNGSEVYIENSNSFIKNAEESPAYNQGSVVWSDEENGEGLYPSISDGSGRFNSPNGIVTWDDIVIRDDKTTFRIKQHGEFGMERQENLNNIRGDFVGQIANHNGEDGNPEGNYEWDGSNWQELKGDSILG